MKYIILIVATMLSASTLAMPVTENFECVYDDGTKMGLAIGDTNAHITVNNAKDKYKL